MEMKLVNITVVEHEETPSWAFYVDDKLRWSGKNRLYTEDLVNMIFNATVGEDCRMSYIEYVCAEEEYAPGSSEGYWPENYGDVDVVSTMSAETGKVFENIQRWPG